MRQPGCRRQQHAAPGSMAGSSSCGTSSRSGVGLRSRGWYVMRHLLRAGWRTIGARARGRLSPRTCADPRRERHPRARCPALAWPSRARGGGAAVLPGERSRPDGRARCTHGAGVIGLGQEHQELVAADARDEIGLASRAAERISRGPKKPVARLVTEPVVRRLQVIEVGRHDGHRTSVAAPPRRLRLHCLVPTRSGSRGP
jgi:hypothetical protein